MTGWFKSKTFLTWFIVVDTLVCVLVIFLIYLGAFSSVTVSEQEMGPYHLVYRDCKGDYSQTGKIIEKTAKALTQEGANLLRACGVYYDDPRKVKKEDLRSEVGFLVAEPDLVKFTASTSFKTKTLPLQTYVTAEFPFKNMLSIYVGIFKVYPKLTQFAGERGYPPGPMMELYDQPGGHITYMMNGQQKPLLKEMSIPTPAVPPKK